MNDIKERLEEIRQSIKDECISYDEIVELQSLAQHISEDDVELLQWAGVQEDSDDDDSAYDEYVDNQLSMGEDYK